MKAIMLTICLFFAFLIFICLKDDIDGRIKRSGKLYHLNLADSPHIANVHPEMDYISGDTIYVNWYSNEKCSIDTANKNSGDAEDEGEHGADFDADTTLHLVKYKL